MRNCRTDQTSTSMDKLTRAFGVALGLIATGAVIGMALWAAFASLM